MPPSKGNTAILTIVDRFAKAVHFVPLPGLPSAAETADLLVLHVVRLHGIPCDIFRVTVSDRGPQFTSKVWQTFCRGIGATVSLSSGYHPQTNGQTVLVRGFQFFCWGAGSSTWWTERGMALRTVLGSPRPTWLILPSSRTSTGPILRPRVARRGVSSKGGILLAPPRGPGWYHTRLFPLG